MNKQEVFNKVWDWFVVQLNPQSTNEVRTCVYRGKNGAKCAIGVLIPDEMYTPEMETTGCASHLFCYHPQLAQHLDISGWTADSTCLPLLFSPETRCDIEFLNDLQDAHDQVSSSMFAQSIAIELRVVAAEHNLMISDKAA